MEKLIHDFSFGLFFWQILIFIGLILLLKKFAWKPILNAVDEREEGIRTALESAEEAKKEMQALTQDNERILNEAKAERDAMLKEARDLSNKMISDSKEEAKIQGQKLIEQAKTSIQNEKNLAVAEIKSQVLSLSVEIAEKLLTEELSNKDAQRKLAEKMLVDVKLS